MKRRLILGTALGLTLLPVARAAELTNAAAVLEFALAQGATYETVTANFTQTLPATLATGVFQFKKPGQSRLEMSTIAGSATQQLLAVLSRDQILWQEVGDAKQIMKTDFKTIPANHPAAALIQNPFDSIDPQRFIARVQTTHTETLTGTTELHGQNMYLLEGTRRADAKLVPRDWGRHRLAIGQQDGFLHQIEQFDTSGSNLLMTIEFTALQFNRDLPDHLFQYQPAPDARVIDMTRVLQMMSKQKSTPRK